MFEKLIIHPELIPSDPRFGCGPSLIPLDRFEALKKTGPHLLGTSHRHTPIKNMVEEIIEGLRSFFQLPSDYDVVLGNGGATFLFDMISLGMVEKNAVHFTCGEFSQKWFQAARLVPGLNVKEEAVKAGEGITPCDVEGVDFIATTLNETSTGVQIDRMPPIRAQYKDKDKEKGKLVAMDATSGAGQVYCDVSQTDIFFFSPQKVFGSEGGLWIAFLSPQAVERFQRILKQKSRYIPEIMRFDYALDNSRKNQTYNTPAITTLFFLNEQVKEMNELGYEKVCALAEEKAKHLYSWAEEKSYLSPYIKEDRYRSRAVATIDVNEKIKVEELTEFLARKQWVYGIDAYRKLGRNQLRISLFHNIQMEDLQKLTRLLSMLMESCL